MTTPRHAAYRKLLHDAGMAPADIEEIFKVNEREEKALDNRVCPKCGTAGLTKSQGEARGPTLVAGLWHTYRCGSCRYVVSRVEES